MGKKESDAIRFLALHLFYGTVCGFTFGILVLATNLSNIRTMMFDSGSPVLALVVMFFGLFITFGGVGMSVGVMSLARDETDER
jgi:hypothetical protein